MTSKEMEARSGVARANIRYYEAEGLLTPARLKNGYRDYSEADLAILEKIKLLRRLGVSVEELKALRGGSTELSAVLDRRLAELTGERAEQLRVEQVCQALRRSGATFQTLNAGKYLSDLDAPALSADSGQTWWSDTPSAPLPAADALPPEPGLARRFFARLFDELLGLYLILAVAGLLGHNPALLNSTLLGFGLQILLLLAEPLLICLLGATPGKALLGLRLTRPDGSRLSYGQAFRRHWGMLWGAVGLGIPIWSLVQMYRTVRRRIDADPQPWDEGIAYAAQPLRFFRHEAAYVLAAAAVLLAGEAVNSFSQLPPNRGSLTVAEFAENFNRQAEYMGLSPNFYLDEAGQWQKIPDPPNVVSISLTGDWQKDTGFQYTVENGRLTAVSMTRSAENVPDWLSIPTETLTTAVTAFAWADAPFWSFDRDRLIDDLTTADWGERFTFRENGVVVTLDIQSRNFYVINGADLAIPDDETDNFFSFTFTMALEE